jgi:hypothetical protein
MKFLACYWRTPGSIARRHPLFIYGHSPVKPNTGFGSIPLQIPQAALF